MPPSCAMKQTTNQFIVIVPSLASWVRISSFHFIAPLPSWSPSSCPSCTPFVCLSLFLPYTFSSFFLFIEYSSFPPIHHHSFTIFTPSFPCFLPLLCPFSLHLSGLLLPRQPDKPPKPAREATCPTYFITVPPTDPPYHSIPP